LMARSHTQLSSRRWSCGIIFTTSGMLGSYSMWQSWETPASIPASGGVEIFRTLGDRCTPAFIIIIINNHSASPLDSFSSCCFKSCPWFHVPIRMYFFHYLRSFFALCHQSSVLLISLLLTWICPHELVFQLWRLKSLHWPGMFWRRHCIGGGGWPPVTAYSKAEETCSKNRWVYCHRRVFVCLIVLFWHVV
jgi:hypothetical protein